MEHKYTSDITFIILTKNEAKNIEKCIQSAKLIAKRIVVVDSGSTDDTVALAEANGAEVYYHPWSSYAGQFNWGLENCNITTEWVFRLDADERVTEELAEEIYEALHSPASENIDGYTMRIHIYFMNKRLRFGGTRKLVILRLFRFGKGRVENKPMDEHTVVEGAVQQLNHSLIHYDYKGLDAWLNKHVWYSGREMQMIDAADDTLGGDLSTQQKKKRGFYYRLPLFWRARFYYWYRYYLQLGFLDGTEGKIFYYLQAYWYRFIIDAKLYEQEKAQGEDR